MKPERWARLGELFHAALDRQPGERAEFLREACGGDESLRREVEALLARHAEVPDFLASPALEAEAQALAGELAAARVPYAASPLPPAIPTGPPSYRPSGQPRPPWWMYALTALFLLDWLLRSYALFLGPRGFDFTRRREEGRWLVAAVAPDSASERAGLRAGDILAAIDGQPLGSPSAWRAIGPNLETGRTYRFDIERGGGRRHGRGSAREGDGWDAVHLQIDGHLLRRLLLEDERVGPLAQDDVVPLRVGEVQVEDFIPLHSDVRRLEPEGTAEVPEDGDPVAVQAIVEDGAARLEIVEDARLLGEGRRRRDPHARPDETPRSSLHGSRSWY